MRQMMLVVLAMAVAMSAVSQRNVMYIDDFEIYPDSTVVVPLMLANSDSTRGVELKMTLPDGLTLTAKQLTDYAEEEYGMVFFGGLSNGVWSLGMYPPGRVSFPPADTAIMTLQFTAAPDFKGGEIILWKQHGSTMSSKTIYFDSDTALVTVPTSSLIGIPMDSRQDSELFFNLMGQPIASPDSVPVAIQVVTDQAGRRSSHKVSVKH